MSGIARAGICGAIFGVGIVIAMPHTDAIALAFAAYAWGMVSMAISHA